MSNVMKTVVKVVKKVRARALETLVQDSEELKCQYGDFLFHTEVR